MSEEVKLSKSAKDKEKQAQDEAKLKTLEGKLFGSDAQGGGGATEPKLLLPDEIKAHFAG